MRKKQPRTEKSKKKIEFSPELTRAVARLLHVKRRKPLSLGPWVCLPWKTSDPSYHIWNSAEQLPNLPDHDPIILVSPESHNEAIRMNMESLKLQIPHLFRAGRTIIWIMTPMKQISDYPFLLTNLVISVRRFLYVLGPPIRPSGLSKLSSLGY
ncbi:MAG: hypothetical protein ACE5OZ_24935 [Candidatus Heimdallarchaeota archaeon]